MTILRFSRFSCCAVSTPRIRLVCVSVMVSLVLAELLLRFMTRLGGNAYRANVLPIYELTNDARPFALRRNFEYERRTLDFDMRIQTNDFGIRENAPLSTLLRHEYKILAMGDSQTFGYGVNYGERYSDLLNSILTSKAVSFTSGYADGFSPVDYVVYLQTFYERLAPDLVVVGFFPENDIVNDVRTRRIIRNSAGDIVETKLNDFTVVDGFITADNATHFGHNAVIAFKNNLWNTFALYRLLEEVRTRVRYWRHPELQHTQLPSFMFGESSNSEEINTTLHAIQQMDRLLKAHGKTLVVCFIPSNFQIASRYDRSVINRPGYRVRPERMAIARNVREPQTSLSRWFAANGVRYLDPTEDFVRAERDGTRFYFDYDGHLSPKGHQRMAKLLEEYFVRNRLIPCAFVKASVVQAVAGGGCRN